MPGPCGRLAGESACPWSFYIPDMPPSVAQTLVSAAPRLVSALGPPDCCENLSPVPALSNHAELPPPPSASVPAGEMALPYLASARQSSSLHVSASRPYEQRQGLCLDGSPPRRRRRRSPVFASGANRRRHRRFLAARSRIGPLSASRVGTDGQPRSCASVAFGFTAPPDAGAERHNGARSEPDSGAYRGDVLAGWSYDHWVRDERELERIAAYIENNPVQAGLATRPEDYAWSSARERRPSAETSLGAADTSVCATEDGLSEM
jgi:hypothetical protein